MRSMMVAVPTPPPGAHGDQGRLLILAFEFVEGGLDQDRAAGADRVAEGETPFCDLITRSPGLRQA